MDGVQPMRSGWQIYVKMEYDHTLLISRGIQLAGKWINLQALVWEPGFANAKIILKDLPINEVSNDEILKAVKQKVDIKSEVWYSNIWIDGKWTHLHNGDHFFYITERDVSQFDKVFQVCDFQAQVIKPASHNRCSCCQVVEHRPSSELCMAKVPPEVQQTVQVFWRKEDPSPICLCAWMGAHGG